MAQELTFTKQRLGHLLNDNLKMECLKLDVKQASSSRLQTIIGSNCLCLGDAACTYDPLSSYGITAAMGAGYYAACAINDYLKGNTDALLAYAYILEKRYGDYLNLIQAAYLAEQRWHTSIFWKRRHGQWADQH